MTARARNPGPSWGFRFLVACDRLLPEVIFRPLRAVGTAVALLGMGPQRRHSRTYLARVLPHPPTAADVFRHFFAFEEFLLLKLRVGRGCEQRTRLDATAQAFASFVADDQPALLGSFHLGHSDLLGFLLAGRYQRPVAMVRQQVGNSHDVDQLLARFGGALKIIWVNQTDNLLFALKDALSGPDSLAMKCDRLEFSAKTEAFTFLGERRLFPFTIYYLAILFRRPVIFSFGLPGEPGLTMIYASPVWTADTTASKAANLARAREHFQAFLAQVESALLAQPYQWFNFTALNPVAP